MAAIIDQLEDFARGIDSLAVTPIANYLQFPDDQIRLIFVWILQMPLGWILHFFVHGAQARNIVNSMMGIPLMFYFFGWGTGHVVLQSTIVYLLMYFTPRDRQPVYVGFYVFAHLSYVHLIRVLYHFGSFDLEISTNLMLLTLRLQALAWSYADGGRDEKDLTQRQKEMMVKKIPTLLEYISFTFFTPQCALGVFFEYADFSNWAHKTGHYTNIPNVILPSLKLVLQGTLSLAVTIIGGMYFSVETFYTDEFGTWSLGYKLFYVHIAWGIKRYFYYSAFMFETAAFIACGLGYNGAEMKDDKIVDHKWDRIIGVYFWEAETAADANSFLKAWNHRVHIWIKYYLSERIMDKDSRPQAWQYLVIYLISAFWHGFYPFYYVTFTCVALCSFAHKNIYQCWFLFRNVPAWLKRTVGMIFLQQHVNYIGALHSSLTVDRGFKFLNNTYYILPILLITQLLITNVAGLLRHSKKMERQAKAGDDKVIELKTMNSKATPELPAEAKKTQ